MSYEQLRQIALENQRLEEDASKRERQACPIDGTPLQRNAKGVLNCPMGNYREGG